MATIKNEAVDRVAEKPDADLKARDSQTGEFIGGDADKQTFAENAKDNNDAPYWGEMNGLVDTARGNVNVVEASENALLTVSRLIREIKSPQDVVDLADAVERTASRFGMAVVAGNEVVGGQTRVVGRV